MAEKRMKHAVMVLAVLTAVFGIFAGNALADQLTIDLPPVNITVTKDADGFAKFTEAEPDANKEVSIQYLSQPGEPAIPYLVVKALLPPGADMSTLEVTVERAAVTSEAVSSTEAWEIRPMPVPQVNADPPALNSSGENEAVYNTSIRFPYSIVGNISTGALWEWQLADIPIALYHWNPVTKGLFTLQSSQAVLTFEHKSIYGRRTAQTFSGMGKDRVKNMVVNFDQVAEEYPAAPARRSSAQEQSSYVIITTNAIRSASTQMGNFIQHKENRGYAVRVITENIWGGGTGNTAAENIRNWLIANYEVMNIEYVLLIGNPNPATGDVPMKMLWPRNNATWETSYKDSPSDFYYADLTGNWDLDGDGRFGEGDNDFGPSGVDRNYEVIVGRIPYYGNAADLDSILAKTIAYQNESNQEWRKKVLLPMEPSDGSTPGYHLGEIIKNNVLAPKGWGFHRVYDSTYSLSPAPETVPCNTNNVTTAWNASDYGAVFWWTHGWENGAVDIMDLSHAAMLDNAHPAFTFQCSCTNSHPETTTNLSYSLLKNGAVATVGATRVSWYYIGQTDFPGTTSNSGMTYEYAKRIISDGMKGGYALHNMKQELIPQDMTIWMNFTDFCLYGDPEVSMIESNVTDNPPVISDIPDQTTQRDIEITVPFTVSDDKTLSSNLKIIVNSSHPSIVPIQNIVIEGSGENRSLSITPTLNQEGSSTITITVKDQIGNISSELFLLTIQGLTSWQWENPIPQGNTFYDMWAISDTDVFAVGGAGTIYHYDGNSWSEMVSGTICRLYAIWGNTGNTIYTAGENGTILYYNGVYWAEMESGIHNNINDIWGIDSNNIYAVGDDGTILHYNGNYWSEMQFDYPTDLNCIWGISANNLFAAGVGAIYHYNGNTWLKMEYAITPLSVSILGFTNIWGTSASNIYAVGGGYLVSNPNDARILHYDGNEWTEINGPDARAYYDIWGYSSNKFFMLAGDNLIYQYQDGNWSVINTGQSTNFFGISGTNTDSVYIGGTGGTICRYSNNNCEKMLPQGWTDQFNSIWGSSSNGIYAVGSGGIIVKYDGVDWYEMESGTNSFLSDIWGNSANNIYAVGNNQILHYDGMNWNSITPNLSKDYSYSGVWGSSGDNIFVVGSNYETGVGTTTIILRYDGYNWESMSSPVNTIMFGDVWGTSESNVYAVGVDTSNNQEGIIIHFDGNQWREMYRSSFQLLDIWGNSASDIYAVGFGNIIFHFDGNEWMQQLIPVETNEYPFGIPNVYFWGVWGSSTNDVYAVGSTIYHYDGVVWKEFSNESSNKIYSVWGNSKDNVYAVGAGGAILHLSTPDNNPLLTVSSATQYLTAFSGTTSITITNAGTGSFTWTAEENEPWFSLSPASGSAPGTLTVTYQSNPGDQRTGKILITAPGAANSPKEITITQAPKAGQHFTPIWTGNPSNRMSFYIVSATLDGIPLSIGDEIAVFDGSRCVGMGIVDGTVSYEKILIVKTSQDDGSGNGFTNGNAITFKYWDVSTGREITLVTPAFKDITGGNPIAAPVFEGLADYGVALSSGGTNQQTLSLNKGWNIMSSYIVPQNTDMLSVVQPLISNGTLNKVISETGDTIINVFGTWMNTIGNYNPEEGYKIKLNTGSQLLITGPSSAPALSNMYASNQSVSIPLTAGWNIVSYPFTNAQDAMAAVQTLINAGVLEKMIDETGNSILKVFGKWTNRIGNLMAGEGYEIKVNKDAVLILYESGALAARTEETREVRAATSHFTPVWTGNPFNRMELHIAGVNASVSVGDEIAVYDGTKCVGAAVVESQISYDSPLIVTCSQDDGTGNGFTDGHAITFRLWDSSQSAESTMPAPNYMDLENGNPIAVQTFKGGEEYGVTWNAIDYTGDLNHNGEVNLEDVILALRIMSGIPVENIYTDADVNNDQLIGIPEAVFGLQKTAKLR